MIFPALQSTGPDIFAALREAVGFVEGPAALAAVHEEISLMLRRQLPGSEAASFLALVRAALNDARATRH